MNDLRRAARGCTSAWERGGTTLVDLLVAMCVALATLAVIASALPPVLDRVQAVPEAVDLHQRARAARAVVTGAVAVTGAGADLLGDGPLVRRVAAVLPRRLGVDPPGSAWADRVSLLHVPDTAAQAPLEADVGVGDTTVRLAWHPACGVHPSCGFRRGDLVLVAATDGAMVLSGLTDVVGRVLTLGAAADQAIALPASASVVRTTTLHVDAGRRQLRRIDDLASTQPVVDEVLSMAVRYYGNPAPPRFPVRVAVDTCAVAADGTPRLGLLGAVPGPLVEMSVSQFTDGPWCGTGAWQFDADLLRVRAVRMSMRLQAGAAAVRGRGAGAFANPGSSVRVGQEVRDVVLDVFADAPNLAWGQ